MSHLIPQGLSKLPPWFQLCGNSGHLEQHRSLCCLPMGTRVSKRYALPYFFSEHPWEAPEEVTKTLHSVESPVPRQRAQLVTQMMSVLLCWHTTLRLAFYLVLVSVSPACGQVALLMVHTLILICSQPRHCQQLLPRHSCHQRIKS